MKVHSFVHTLLISIFLTGCGGGSSSGGGGNEQEQSKDLSYCVAESIVRRVTELIDDTTFEWDDYTYTNLCGEDVNLSLSIGIGSIIDTILLTPNATYEDSQLANTFEFEFIACRPPSIGIDTASDNFLAQLECS